jgi:hypothetical protein
MGNERNGHTMQRQTHARSVRYGLKQGSLTSKEIRTGFQLLVRVVVVSGLAVAVCGGEFQMPFENE